MHVVSSGAGHQSADQSSFHTSPPTSCKTDSTMKTAESGQTVTGSRALLTPSTANGDSVNDNEFSRHRPTLCLRLKRRQQFKFI